MLLEYFENNPGRLMHKWVHYFEIYERHFARFRGRPVTVLEIGVFHGGSLQMWKEYFGPQARIFGVDILPACKTLEEDRISIHIGDQGDRAFLGSLRDAMPRPDVLIDDGGHRMQQQIVTFEELYPWVADDGVYLCEDLQTNYHAEFGGGLRQPGTFIEYSKRLIDQLNAWHTRDPETWEVDDFTLSTHSMHFYDAVLAIEKRPMQPSHHRKTGRPSFGPDGLPIARA